MGLAGFASSSFPSTIIPAIGIGSVSDVRRARLSTFRSIYSSRTFLTATTSAASASLCARSGSFGPPAGLASCAGARAWTWTRSGSGTHARPTATAAKCDITNDASSSVSRTCNTGSCFHVPAFFPVILCPSAASCSGCGGCKRRREYGRGC